MNLCDTFVEEVLDNPRQAYGKWFVKVRANSWGAVNEQEIMVDSKEEADSITVGYKYLS